MSYVEPLPDFQVMDDAPNANANIFGEFLTKICFYLSDYYGSTLSLCICESGEICVLLKWVSWEFELAKGRNEQ